MTPARCEESREYSFIRHLANAVWVNHDPARCWLTTWSPSIPWSNYYDASGCATNAKGRMVVAGIAAHETGWLDLESAWKRDLLKEFDIPYLHMRTFSHDAAHLKRQGRDQECLKTALKIIKDATEFPFVVAVDLEGYREADKVYPLSEMALNPYAATATLCVKFVGDIIQGDLGEVPMIHLIEKGDAGQKDFVEALEGKEFVVLAVPKKDKATGESIIPFQATDLIAWITQRVYARHAVGDPWEPIAHTLIDLLPIRDSVWNTENLLALCKHLRLRRRPLVKEGA